MYRAVPVLENQTLTSFLNAQPSLKARRAAVRAFFAAVRRRLRRVGALAFLDEERLLDSVVEVVPRQHLVEATLPVCVERGVDFEVGEDLHPRVEVKAVRPAVEAQAAAVRLEQDRVELPVAARKHGLEEARLRAVVVDGQLARGHRGFQQLLLSLERLDRILAEPLERREGLRHKRRRADRDGRALALLAVFGLIIPIDHLLAELRDAGDVLVGLGRQADHEIQLHLGPAVVEGDRNGPLELVLQHVLVDDIAQALRAGFRRKGEAALSHRGDLVGQLS